MIEFQRQNIFYLFNVSPQCSSPFLEKKCQFFGWRFWQQHQRILGSAKGRGTTWFIQSEDIFGVNAALRHYYRGGLWGKINSDRYWFKTLTETRSFAEFHLLAQLHQAGLAVPKPLAARVIKGKWGCYQADILTEKVENAQDLTAYLQQQSLTEQQWHQVGKLIAQLHKQQVCHTDLNAHNILLQQHLGEEKFWLIDFDKCAVKAGDNWKSENLARLQRSFNKEVQRMGIRFDDEQWQMLLAGYQQNI